MAAKNNTRDMQELFSQFQAFLASTESPKGTSRGATRKASAKPKIDPKVLTMAQAWALDTRSAGESQPDWARDDKPASAKQLYALNLQGCFTRK